MQSVKLAKMSQDSNDALSMDTTEAAKALFFLQTSPVVTPVQPSSNNIPSNNFLLAPRLDAGLSLVANEPRQVSIVPRAKSASMDTYFSTSLVLDRDMKPGPALLALMNMNRIYGKDLESYDKFAKVPSGKMQNGEESNSEETNTSSDPSSDEDRKRMLLKGQDVQGASVGLAKQRTRLGVAVSGENFDRIRTRRRNSRSTGGIVNGIVNVGVPKSNVDSVMTRARSESLSVVEKRFSGDSMSIESGNGNKIGHYSREERMRLIDRFLKKRNRRIWRKRVKYDVRKSFADSRLRVKGRFVRKEDEEQLRELLILSF